MVQNAADSCLVRNGLSSDASYAGRVEITDDVDEDGRIWIRVRDNGIGMGQHILQQHLFRVGSSYYRTTDFHRLWKGRQFAAAPTVSRYGIGFLAAFMLADAVEIETKSVSLGSSDTTGRYVRVDRLGAIAYVREDPRIKEGTTIGLRLALPSLKNAISAVKYSNILVARFCDHLAP